MKKTISKKDVHTNVEIVNKKARNPSRKNVSNSRIDRSQYSNENSTSI